MSQLLLSDKDLSFPNTQVTKTMDSTSRTQESPGAAPDMGFPGGGSGVRQAFIFGSIVKGATKLAKSAGESLLSKAEQTAIKNSKEYKQTIKELTTDNAQGAGVIFDISAIKAMERNNPADVTAEMFNELLMFKNKQDDFANELIKAGVSPASVKRILNKGIKDTDLTEGERSIRSKFINKYFPKTSLPPGKTIAEALEEGLDIDSKGNILAPVKRGPILIEHQAGKEPKAMGGRMAYQEGSLVGKQTELDVNNDGKISGKDFQMLKNKRMGKQEGSLMVPPEMESDMPVDTYPNIPPEEMDEAMESQLPDSEMEDKYTEFVLDQSLDDEEQDYLMNALEADPKLSQIFDKVVTAASEFTGAGEVEGPGTGVSDSIPARLSDGEFVFTKKATDQMGADNLQMMMDDAERAFDGGQMRSSKQDGGLMYKQKDEDPLAYEKIAQDEIKKNMLRSNRAPSLLGGN